MTNKRCAEVIQAVKFMLDDTDYTEEVEEALTMAQQMLGNADEEIDCPLHGEHEEGIWDNGYRRGYGRAMLDFGLEDWGKPSEMLDKIRDEIKALSPEPTAYDVVDGNPIKDAVWETIADVLQIIDKYKGESEEV